MRYALLLASTLCHAIALAGCTPRSTPPQETAPKPSGTSAPSDIDADEELVFFATAAHLDETAREWIVPIHGVIYEPEEDSIKRAPIVAAVRHAVQTPMDASDTERLEQRVRLFLVDNERGQRIAVRLGSEIFDVGTSGPNGHFQNVLRLPSATIELLATPNADGQRFLTFTAVTKAADERVFQGRVQIVSPEGLSVISDIDDTVKHSQVGDHRQMLANTFVHEYAAVAGMPQLYRTWAKQGIVFHYVSGSPWQLYGPLAAFFDAQQLPVGSVDLKNFRLKDPSALDLLRSQEETKLRAIEPLLQAYPRRRFILIGDSGEEDPEIFTRIARAHNQQVAAIFIRNVTQESPDNARIAPLRQGLEPVQFHLFLDPAELPPLVARLP